MIIRPYENLLNTTLTKLSLALRERVGGEGAGSFGEAPQRLNQLAPSLNVKSTL